MAKLTLLLIAAALALLAGMATFADAQTYKVEGVRSISLASAGNDPGTTLTMKVPAMPFGNIVLTFPNHNAAGMLTNDGTGSLSWAAAFVNPMTGPGDMIYGGASGAATRLAATATANQILLSGANAAPSWSTATYPAASGSAGNYLRSNGTNFVSSGIQATDVPTLNQNTTGSAAKLTTARTIAGNSFDGSANITLSNKFIAQGTSDAGLTGAQFLGSLGTGMLKNTTATGLLSIASAGTDYSVGTAALGTGILKSAMGTGALTIALASDFPTLNQNTTGTAANVTGVVGLANGGTGVTNASGVAQNAFFAGPSSGGTGTASWRALSTSDIPSLSGTYLALTGGTMSGNLAMGTHNITGAGTITSSGTIQSGTASSATGGLALANSSSANLTTIQAGNATSAVTYSLPTAAPSSSGQALTSTTGGIMSWANPTPAPGSSSQGQPGNPTGTSSTTAVMMGVAQSITPASSGKVLIIISGSGLNSADGDGGNVQIHYGTGSAPSNGAASTGTAVGSDVQMNGGFKGSQSVLPWSVNAVVTGLTVGTTYWIDVGLSSTASGNTASLQNISVSAVEIP